MNEKIRIEVDEATALVLEARAAARGITVAQLIADLAGTHGVLPPELRAHREAGAGPWAPGVLADDARRLADFQRAREAVPLGRREGVDAELGHAPVSCRCPSRASCSTIANIPRQSPTHQK